MEKAVNVFYEIGAKLCYTIWRKMCPGELEEADAAFNHCCFRLIKMGQYELAGGLLEYACSAKKYGSDKTRRMMIVNRANALKLSGDLIGARKILNGTDW